ncbi:MAG: FkbM family methyltransferase, partial [Chloroflexi bacterium]|nr:FkbM family methyltransferase [Chloroflexota bacterium]
MDRQARVKPLPRVVRRGIDAARRLFPSLPVPYPLPWGGWLLLGPDGTGLGLLNGTYEEQKELDWIQRVLKPGMVFFDIGANQGIYTVVAAKAVGETGRVYAFEPVPSELRKLRANLRFNRLRNVTVVDKAVGDYDGTTTIHACEPHKGGFSSIKAPSDYLNLKWEIIEVPIMRLDTFVQQQGIERIDYLKMDVEGAERIVIAG